MNVSILKENKPVVEALVSIWIKGNPDAVKGKYPEIEVKVKWVAEIHRNIVKQVRNGEKFLRVIGVDQTGFIVLLRVKTSSEEPEDFKTVGKPVMVKYENFIKTEDSKKTS